MSLLLGDTEKPDYRKCYWNSTRHFGVLESLHIPIIRFLLISAGDIVNAGWLSPTYFFIYPRPSFPKFLVTGDVTQTFHHNLSYLTHKLPSLYRVNNTQNIRI